MPYCRHLPEHVEHYGLSCKSYPLGSHFKGQTFFWYGEAAASEILRCLQKSQPLPLHFLHVCLFRYFLVSFPSTPSPANHLPEIMQIPLFKNTLQSEFTHRLPPPHHPHLCTFLPGCLKTDDLNLIWRCNAFRQCYTHSCVFVFLLHH